jgi:ubiquinone/menaquinone biosynthesis C-methylase UbiE
LGHVRRFLDLACGTGTATILLLEASPSANLNGVDLDPVQIGLITDRFRGLGYEVRQGFELSDGAAHGKPVLTFAVGSADELPFPTGSFDCVTIFNAIHLLPNKETFLQGVERLLKPGGQFGFNSTFYAGCIPPGGNKLYFEWLRLATEYIEGKNKQLREQGQEPFKRIRGGGRAAFSNRWLSPGEWTQQLTSAGLTVDDVHERCVEVDARCFALVGAYGGLAEVLLSGYPVEAASEALQACAKEAMDRVGVSTVARNYLEVWATKS